jgi:hypothetical protein
MWFDMPRRFRGPLGPERQPAIFMNSTKLMKIAAAQYTTAAPMWDRDRLNAVS